MSTTDTNGSGAIDLTDDDPSGSEDRVHDAGEVSAEEGVPAEPITPDVVEDQIRETVEVAEQAVQDNKAKLIAGGLGGLVVVLLLVFLLGRRRGKQQVTTVELVEV
jgi:hypothetical protein